MTQVTNFKNRSVRKQVFWCCTCCTLHRISGIKVNSMTGFLSLFYGKLLQETTTSQIQQFDWFGEEQDSREGRTGHGRGNASEGRDDSIAAHFLLWLSPAACHQVSAKRTRVRGKFTNPVTLFYLYFWNPCFCSPNLERPKKHNYINRLPLLFYYATII